MIETLRFCTFRVCGRLSVKGFVDSSDDERNIVIIAAVIQF